MKRSAFHVLSAPLLRSDSRVALALLAFATGRSGRFQVAFILLFLLALLYGVRHDFTVSTYRRAAVANPFFVAFSAWFVLSVAWANDLLAGVQEAAILATGWLALGFCRRRLATDTLLWSVLAVSCTMAVTDLLLFSLDFQFVRSRSGGQAGLPSAPEPEQCAEPHGGQEAGVVLRVDEAGQVTGAGADELEVER
ncbi:MAG: hypothetical protein AAFO29_25150, partial [Actinomycetota bacterium]